MNIMQGVTITQVSAILKMDRGECFDVEGRVVALREGFIVTRLHITNGSNFELTVSNGGKNIFLRRRDRSQKVYSRADYPVRQFRKWAGGLGIVKVCFVSEAMR